jgi:hypothetical protein
MKQIISVLLAASLLLATASLNAEQYAVTLRDTGLRDGPYRDAVELRRLPSDTRLQILERKGGWYQINFEKHTGWVRLTGLRLERRKPGKNKAKGKGKTGAPGQQKKIGKLDTLGEALTGGLFSTGHGSSSEVTSTTGIRGLDAEQLDNASPDPEAVNALDNFAVSAEQAQRFAARQQLLASRLDYFTGDAAGEGSGGLLDLFSGGNSETSEEEESP